MVLRAGNIEQVGAPMDLYRDPDNRFVAGFIGSPAMNFVGGSAADGGVIAPFATLERRYRPTGAWRTGFDGQKGIRRDGRHHSG